MTGLAAIAGHFDVEILRSIARQHLLGKYSFGIVQKVFSEKASAIARMRQKCVKNASEMRQKRVLSYWEKRNVQNASEIRQKCLKNARNTFGGEHLLDDTDSWATNIC